MYCEFDDPDLSVREREAVKNAALAIVITDGDTYDSRRIIGLLETELGVLPDWERQELLIEQTRFDALSMFSTLGG